MSQPVVQAIYDRLAGDQSASSFHAAVGGRYYHLESPENATLPLCVFGIDDPAVLDLRYDGSEVQSWMFIFQIFVLNTDPTPDVTASAIDEKLRSRLHKAELTGVSGYDRLTVLCDRNGSATKDEEAVRVQSAYRVFGTRTS